MPGTRPRTEIAAALAYHERTKHTEDRLRQYPHELDWANRPLPFKVYQNVESVPLPADPAMLTGTTPPALLAIAAPPDEGSLRDDQEVVPDLEVLTRVLYLSAGITKRKRLPGGGELYFRAYPNTGALYHVDLYLVTADLPDLPAGVYHFGPEDFALHRLRSGDHRGHLVEATGNHPRIAEAPVIVAGASTYWRNAWKYRERAYRHCFWDVGTLHANLLAVSERGDALAPTVVMGFADDLVETLLGLDPVREGALTLVPLGRTRAPPASPPRLESLQLQTKALSRSEVDYPLIRETHEASSLASGEAAGAWRAGIRDREIAPTEAAAPWRAGGIRDREIAPTEAAAPWRVGGIRDREIAPTEVAAAVGDGERTLADVIRRRGSTRAFDRTASIPFEALSTALRAATTGIPADFLETRGATLLELYLIVHAVEGLAPGLYRHHRRSQILELLAEGDFRRRAGRLALGQALAADASANVYSTCDLDAVLERFGNRGYRAAQLEGGITGGRLYLAAYAQGLGATGLTFFDDEVIELFSPAAAGRSVMFLTALGRADRAALRGR